ncbi:hypothetical protein G6F56_012137 [Rhizopus delemar]|nr:hypothetical protein G6F56_012137 [Rhizopus delemar]
MTLDPDDLVWKSYFTNHEINEIKAIHKKPLPIIPTRIEEYLGKYNQQWETAKDLYNFAKDQKHDPVSEFSLKWIEEIFLGASELFLFDETLTLNVYFEADLLHDVWSFVYRAFKDKKTKFGLGKRASVAVALGKK